MEGLTSSEGLAGQASPVWDLSGLLDTLRLFSSGSHEGLIVYVVLVAVAAVALARNAPDALVIAVLWLVVPLVVILGLPFAHELRVRYFLCALPVYLFLTACGLRVAVGWFADRFGKLSASAGPRRTVLASAVTATIAVVLVLGLVGLLHVQQLIAYYAETKLNWRDAVSLVNTLAEPGEQVFVPHLYHQKGFLFYVAQSPPGRNRWSEDTVRIVPRNLADAFPPGGDGRRWLIVKGKTRFVRDGLEELNQLNYTTRPLVTLASSQRPQEAKLIAPRSYGTLVVVQVEPAAVTSVRFWADADSLDGEQCTWLHWEAEGVSEVYLGGEGVLGRAHRQVCPVASTSYELEVVHLDGTVTQHIVEIEVARP